MAQQAVKDLGRFEMGKTHWSEGRQQSPQAGDALLYENTGEAYRGQGTGGRSTSKVTSTLKTDAFTSR